MSSFKTQFHVVFKKECRYEQTDDIAEVDIGELERTEKIRIYPGLTKKCRYRRTVDIAEVDIYANFSALM